MLCLLLEGKKKKRKRKKKKKWPGFFPPGQDMPCWLCYVGVLWLLGAVKG
jgi:hypothetical protein